MKCILKNLIIMIYLRTSILFKFYKKKWKFWLYFNRFVKINVKNLYKMLRKSQKEMTATKVGSFTLFLLWHLNIYLQQMISSETLRKLKWWHYFLLKIVGVMALKRTNRTPFFILIFRKTKSLVKNQHKKILIKVF